MIRYRLSDYRRTVKPTLVHIEDDASTSLEKISKACQITQAPLLCVAAIYSEYYGPSEEVTSFIRRLKDFYNADFKEE